MPPNEVEQKRINIEKQLTEDSHLRSRVIAILDGLVAVAPHKNLTNEQLEQYRSVLNGIIDRLKKKKTYNAARDLMQLHADGVVSDDLMRLFTLTKDTTNGE